MLLEAWREAAQPCAMLSHHHSSLPLPSSSSPCPAFSPLSPFLPEENRKRHRFLSLSAVLLQLPCCHDTCHSMLCHSLSPCCCQHASDALMPLPLI